MQGAEAFFNKPSPFQKAAEYKEESAAASASASTADAEATAAGTSADARVLDAVESAETAAETTETVIEVGTPGVAQKALAPYLYASAHGYVGADERTVTQG